MQCELGIVVLIVLIVVLALSLSAVGLMRSVDTTSLIVGNIAFRQSAHAISTSTVEKALYEMLPRPGSIDLTTHDIDRNYYAFWQGSDDAFGVPAVLRGNLSEYPATFQVLTDDVGNSARYVVERMCRDASSLNQVATPDRCEMIVPKQTLGTVANDPSRSPVPTFPYYRLTVRVDGPVNTVTFGQAMIELSGALGQNRLSWRGMGQ